MMGFMGMGMAQQAGGVNAAQLYQMAAQQQAAQPAPAAPTAAPAANTWKCGCGAENTGKFCVECGTKKPASEPTYRCDKCGWEPDDPKNPPKFCPECGDRFDGEDII